jgi:hypothetical protein
MGYPLSSVSPSLDIVCATRHVTCSGPGVPTGIEATVSRKIDPKRPFLKLAAGHAKLIQR